MNRRNVVIALGIVVASAVVSQASVSVQIGVGDWSHYGAYYGGRGYRHYRPYRAVAVAPVVIAPTPYYGGYAYPVYAPVPPRPVNTSFSGDYGTDLADVNGKLSRLRGVVHRQNQKGSISQDQYNRFMNALEGVEHDEHARAFDRGGNLTPDDLADLSRRLDQTGEDIEIALSE